MANETKKRPSLSVLLALKGLVPLEDDCTDILRADLQDKIIVVRTYQDNPDFTRRIELPAGSVKPYEYDGEPAQKRFEG